MVDIHAHNTMRRANPPAMPFLSAGVNTRLEWIFQPYIQQTQYEPERTISCGDDSTPIWARSSILGASCAILWVCLIDCLGVRYWVGNAGDGNEKPPHGFAMRGLGGCLGYLSLGVLPVPEDIRHRLPQFDCGPVPSHRAELGDWLAPFQHDGNDCHLGCLPPGSFCGGLGCADCALHVSSRATDLQLVAADLAQYAGEARHGFTFLSSGAGVRMCPPYIPYSPGRLDNSHRGKLFS